MNKALESYTREELERKLLHLTNFAANKLATEWIELTQPTAKVIRTPEAEMENTQRILDFMVLAWPAWDIIEKTHDGYEIMKPWIEKNHEQTVINACVCSGCASAPEVN